MKALRAIASLGSKDTTVAGKGGRLKTGMAYDVIMMCGIGVGHTRVRGAQGQACGVAQRRPYCLIVSLCPSASYATQEQDLFEQLLGLIPLPFCIHLPCTLRKSRT